MGGQRSSLPFATSYQQAQHQHQHQMMHNRDQLFNNNNMNNMQTTPSDDEVRSATKDIVSKAIDALLQNENMNISSVQQQQAQTRASPPQSKSKLIQRSRRHTVDSMPTNTGTMSRLDAMTDLFLERSIARLQSRPVSLMGPRTMSPPHSAQAGSPSIMQQQQPLFMGGGGGENVAMMSRQQQSLIASVGAEVEAQTKACLGHRQQRKVSMPMDSCYGV